MSEKPLSLHAKLAEILGEVGYVEKRGVNDFHRYKYATEADLLEAVRGKLAARNVMVYPSTREIRERTINTKKGESTVSTVLVDYTFVNGDNPEEMFTVTFPGQGEDAADKGVYAALTGSSKYFLMKTFMVPTGDDPEAKRSADEAAATRIPTPPPAAVLNGEQLARVMKKFTEAGVTPEEFEQRCKDVGATPERITVDQAKQLAGWLEKFEQGKELAAA